MPRVVTRSLRKPIIIKNSITTYSNKPHSQAIQLVDAPNNELQQLVMIDLPFHQIPIEHEEKKAPKVPSTCCFLTPQQSSQQQRLNAQPNGQNTSPIQHANEVTYIEQRWQFVTPNYYIPKVIIPSRSTLIVGYYTFEPILILSPIVANSNLEHHQLLNRLEQLCNL